MEAGASMRAFLSKHAMAPGAPDPEQWLKDMVATLDKAEAPSRRARASRDGPARAPVRARDPCDPRARPRVRPRARSVRQVFTPQALVYVDTGKIEGITPGKQHALDQAVQACARP